MVLVARRLVRAAQGWRGRSLSRWRAQSVPSCDEVALELPAILDRESCAPAQLVRHVQSCLHCQAELARYRRLLRLLHQLRATEVDPPAGVVSEVLSAIEEVASRRMIGSLLTGRRLGYAAALTAAGGAAAALVTLALARSRRATVGGMAGASS